MLCATILLMRKLYVGCSLTQAPKDFVEKIENLKTQLRLEWEVLDFIGLKNGTATDVYKWDIHRCIANCDIFVAICDFPAIGLGYEMAAAIEKYGKPTLGLVHEDSKVSRLVIGIDNPVYTLVKYRDFDEIPEIIRVKEKKHFETI